MATKKANTNDFSEYKRKFWQLFAYGFLGVILLFLFASWGFFGKMPSFDDLENFRFKRVGKYNVEVVQAVRETGKVDGVSELKGITELGLRIEKIK